MAARFSAANYLAALQSLLPRGRVWPRDPNANQTKTLACFAPALERVDAAAVSLLADTMPSTTVNLIDEWEATLGLPDPCLGPNPTRQQRLDQIVSRFTDGGGQSVQRYIDYAASIGFEIEITVYAPFRAGRSRVGQPLTGEEWAFAWLVTILSDSTSADHAAFRVGEGRAGDPLSSTAAGRATLECELLRIAPAHTALLFAS